MALPRYCLRLDDDDAAKAAAITNVEWRLHSQNSTKLKYITEALTSLPSVLSILPLYSEVRKFWDALEKNTGIKLIIIHCRLLTENLFSRCVFLCNSKGPWLLIVVRF